MHTFYQCTRPSCKLRFPASAEIVELCPRCHAPLTTTATLVHGLSVPAPINRPMTTPIVAILDNVRSCHNVGAIFRSAEGAGIRQIYLCGITPTPDDPQIGKTALGAEEWVGWSTHRNAIDLAKQLSADGYRLWALEGGSRSHALYQARPMPNQRIALIVGSETAGVDPDLLALCDAVWAIPMRGYKKSLNVAVAFGIGCYQLLANLEQKD